APFDPDFLPDAISSWVMDITNRTQCQPDNVAVAAMTGLGAVIGRRVGIKPQMNTDWVEVPNIWGATIGRPGLIKSGAQKCGCSATPPSGSGGCKKECCRPAGIRGRVGGLQTSPAGQQAVQKGSTEGGKQATPRTRRRT